MRADVQACSRRHALPAAAITLYTLFENCMKTESRLEYYDFVRGIAVIMVVAIHTFDSVYAYETLTLAGVFVRQLLNCAVPLFCVSSAFFLINKDTENYRAYLFPHVLRVWLPLLVYSLPWFAADVWQNGGSITSALKLIGGGYSVYYFAGVVVQFYVLLPLFQKYRVLRNVGVMGLITLLWLVGFVYSPALFLNGRVILCWIVYFALGAAYAKDGMKSRVSVRLCAAGCIAAAVLCCAESVFLTTANESLSGVGIKPSAVLFSVCACALLYADRCAQAYRSGAVTRRIARLGRFSYGMYLGHLYVLWAGGKICAYTGFDFPGIKLLWWAAYTAAAVGVTFGCLALAKKMSPKLSVEFLGV